MDNTEIGSEIRDETATPPFVDAIKAPVLIACTKAQVDAILYGLSLAMPSLEAINTTLSQEGVPAELLAIGQKAMGKRALIIGIGNALTDGTRMSNEHPDMLQLHRIVDLDPNADAIRDWTANAKEVLVNVFHREPAATAEPELDGLICDDRGDTF